MPESALTEHPRPGTGDFTNFAFISYSRKDAKAAAWLQRRLEWFRFPIHLVERDKAPPHSRYLRPIYRDKTHLENDEAHYWRNICSAIEKSRYLIVLCSSHSASSKPVDDEVKHFLSTRGDLPSLVPVILSGRVSPGHDDNCLCPELETLGDRIIHRNFPNMAAEGETSETDAWERGFVGIISYMLGLRREALADHIRREERRRTARARLVAAVTGVLALLAISGAFFSVIKTREAKQATLVAEKARNEAAQKNIEASLKAHGRARQAFAADDDLGGMAFLAEAIRYDPENTLFRKDAFLRLLWGRPISPLPKHEFGTLDDGQTPLIGSDGSRLVAAISPDTLVIWDPETGEPVGKPLQHAEPISSFALCPDNSFLISSGYSDKAVFWDLSTGRHLASAPEGIEMRQPAFSADGKWMAAYGPGSTVRLWDTRALDAPGMQIGGVFRYEVVGLAFSPDGSHLFTSQADSTGHLWDIESGNQIGGTIQHTTHTLALPAFSPDGKKLAAVTDERTCQIWNVGDGTPAGPRLEHAAVLTSAVFSPDGTTLLTCDGARALMWDVATGASIGKSMDHQRVVWTAKFSPDGSRIVTASEDGTAAIWDTASGLLLGRAFQHDAPVKTAFFDPAGSSIITLSGDRQLRSWDTSFPTPMPMTLLQTHPVRSAEFSHSGKSVATIHADASRGGIDDYLGLPRNPYEDHVGLWNADTGSLIGKTSFQPEGIGIASFGKDDSFLVTSNQAGALRRWDAGSGKPISEWVRLQDFERCLAVSHSGSHSVLADQHGKARIVDLASGQPLGESIQHDRRIGSAMFSPGDSRILIASGDGFSRIWDASSGRPAGHEFSHGPGFVCFDPRGEFIITTGTDRSVKIWNSSNGQPQYPPFPHDFDVRRAEMNFDGSRILAIGEDGSGTLWDVTSRLPLKEKVMFGNQPDRFSRDGLHLLTGRITGVELMESRSGIPVGPPLFSRTRLESFSFSPDARRIASATAGFAVDIWTIGDLSKPLSIPPELLAVWSGKEISEDGRMVEIPLTRRIRSRNEMLANPSWFQPDRERRLLHWLFLPSSDHTLSAFDERRTSAIVPEFVNWIFALHSSGQFMADFYQTPEIYFPAKTHDEYLSARLRQFREVAPVHPLLPFASALVEKNSTRKAFLISYGTDRVPDDSALLKQAAHHLRQLDAPEEALRVVRRALGHTPDDPILLEIEAWASSQR